MVAGVFILAVSAALAYSYHQLPEGKVVCRGRHSHLSWIIATYETSQRLFASAYNARRLIGDCGNGSGNAKSPPGIVSHFY